jgi:hypothetical protein
MITIIEDNCQYNEYCLILPNVLLLEKKTYNSYITNLLVLLGTCKKHWYCFGVTCCASNAFCIINSKVLRQWEQEFDRR